MPAHNYRCAWWHEGAVAVTARPLHHLDRLQLNKLLGRELHRLAIGIIGLCAALFRLGACILSKLHLLFGLNSLLLSGSFDPLIFDGVRRYRSSNRKSDQLNRQLFSCDEIIKSFCNLRVNRVYGASADGNLVHAVLTHLLTN